MDISWIHVLGTRQMFVSVLKNTHRRKPDFLCFSHFWNRKLWKGTREWKYFFVNTIFQGANVSHRNIINWLHKNLILSYHHYILNLNRTSALIELTRFHRKDLLTYLFYTTATWSLFFTMLFPEEINLTKLHCNDP